LKTRLAPTNEARKAQAARE
jgi:hypothetical protein